MSQSESHLPGWNADAARALQDQRAEYDDEREHCPISYSSLMHWSVLRHEDVVRVVTDHETFSNVVSRHPSVPNGMDPPEHTSYRRLILPYFSAERMRAFESACRAVMVEMVRNLPRDGEIEMMDGFAHIAAARIHCAFLGWPDDLHPSLADWTARSTEATRAQDRQALATIASEFEQLVGAMIDQRRTDGIGAHDDVMSGLLQEQVMDRPLSDAEITSILRNWTVGEIGTVAASIGILAGYLADHPDLQEQLRADPALLPQAIDEILRIDGPLVANRRVTTRQVEIGGETLAAGERVTVNWISANRDSRVFPEPDACRLDRNPADNLLYGKGIHVCPGAPLARMELRVTMEELLKGTSRIEPGITAAPVRATHPSSGYASLPLRIR